MFEYLTEKQQKLLRSLINRVDEGSVGMTGQMFIRRRGVKTVGVTFIFEGTLPDALPDGWHEANQADIEAFFETGLLQVISRSSQGVAFRVNAVAIRKALEESHNPHSQKPSQSDKLDPVEIQSSLSSFRTDFPEASKTAFIIMRFGNTPAHKKIVDAIKDSLDKFNLVGIRADDKRYNDDLFANVMTYMYGCSFGIAVVERIEKDEFNPNVSLEMGYMMALGKPVCILKDKTLKALPTDLMGKLYDEFDTQDPLKTIPPVLQKWLEDKGLK